MTENDIERFVVAQDTEYYGYEKALAEMQEGEKRTHWIWYIFPQLRGLGHSDKSYFYGIYDLAEAKEYLAHPVLGARLREVTQAVLDHAEDRLASELMGWDDCKLKSCMTLFDKACPDDIFSDVLEYYFEGERDQRTLDILRHRG